MDCIFCKIVDGSIPSQKVYEDEHVLAFKDINPVAPIHVVIIPKKHINSLMDLKEEDMNIVNWVFKAAKEIAKKTGISEDGFRIVTNCGEKAGQSVKHLHFHLIGGRDLQWPPG